ncbi:MAG: TVP38/TMEM64 family protein [Clostridium sp.]|uniref:TVP38/TMEM64 family protein n=1 Tax=Clostridium culturomicium TaxID=1499683 RepID=UPI000AB6652E|nr:TVP38/TMEM64 family protein [Clostridium culturomicium]MDU4889394.1 TVP38/TMEM64 family protein [Clostridium sp.]MDU7082963.1 TVP38/TMEM64 family protein [Clostridium sp.]
MKNKRTMKVLAIVVAVLLVILLIKYMPKLLLITVSLEEFKKYILSMGHFGVLMIILFQGLQTIIAPIPGEVIQIAGGYLYGIPLGTIYNLIGLIIGSGMAFYFARLIGRDFVENLIKKKNLKWINNIMESKKFEIILFIIFIVPGLPKDFMIYVAGLTNLKPIKFFVISVISRLPWIMISASVGANINAGNYGMTIVILVIAIIGFLLGVLYKDWIIKKLSKEQDEDIYHEEKLDKFN